MRKGKVAIAGLALILGSLASMASAQYSRERDYQDGSRRGQAGQGARSQYGAGQGEQFRSTGGVNQRYYARRVSAPAQGDSATDQQLASWLLVDNRGEIQMARLAQEHASCDDVKQFAEKLIDEHAQMVEDLQQFAGRGGASRQQGGGLNFVRLKQQLGQQCATSAEQELNEKDGDEFDKCFIGMQIAKHMEMLDTLKVFSRYASPELDELIEDAEQKTEDHLEHAKKLIRQLEQDSDSASNRSSGRSSSDRGNRRDRKSDEG